MELKMVGVAQPELFNINCPVCGTKEAVSAGVVKWNKIELRFVVCAVCGLKYMNPRPSNTWYEDYYKATFWAEHTDFESPAKVERKRRKEERRVRMLLAMITPRVNIEPGDNVLDIGTGWGFLPRKLHEKTGCIAAAVEPSDYTAEYFERELDIERVARSIYDPALVKRFGGKIKLLTFSTSLENTCDPLSALRIARILLRDDGVLFIHTPNLYFEDTVDIFHPQLFTPECLECLLARAGFDVVWLRHSPRPGDGIIKMPKQAGGISGEDSSSPVNPLRIDTLACKGAARPCAVKVSAEAVIECQRQGLAMMARHVARSRIKNGILGPIARAFRSR